MATDACGNADLTTRSSSLSVLLSTRLYLTGNGASPCPQCLSGSCSGGARAGMMCSGTGTTNDCPPLANQFIGVLAVSLAPLTTARLPWPSRRASSARIS